MRLHRSVRLMLLLVVWLGVPGGAAIPGDESTGDGEAQARRVVLVTIDGVRREELLGELDVTLDARVPRRFKPMPYFTDEMMPRGATIGLGAGEPAMTVANSEIVSLPAYMSMMAGRPQPCFGNDCGRIFMDRTLPERLIRDEGFARKDVATISSWEKIAQAVEVEEGTTFVNSGARAWEIDDPIVRELNAQQAADTPPWASARYDRYTAAMALRYFDLEAPRFLYVSFNDTDEWGHKGKYLEHLQAMQRADAFLRDIEQRLIAADRADGGRSCLLVTTDHGRGRGAEWTTHSNGAPYAGLIWAYASCDLEGGKRLQAPETESALFHTHVDLRPTIERWLGLNPRSCALCGSAIERFL